MKKLFILLALTMALCIALPLAAGPIDTGPPVAMPAQAGYVTAAALPAVSPAPDSLAIESPSCVVDLYATQGNPAPTLAYLMQGAAASPLDTAPDIAQVYRVSANIKSGIAEARGWV